MKKICAMLAALMLAMTMMGTAEAKGRNKPEPRPIWYCGAQHGDRIVNVNRPKMKVVVQEGADCTIINSRVKSVQAINTARDVNIWDTKVKRGVHVMGATGTVHIGVKKCNYDPPVGNNVKVTKSHNVLICYVTAKNNIMVNDNDGRVTVRDSVAGNNIMVNRNRPYVSDGNETHRNPGAIRILRNRAGNHITARKNSDRDVIVKLRRQKNDSNSPPVRS